MADNTVLNSGSGGDTISTDDIAGVKVQRVKVQYGVDGSATDVSDTNPLPIDDAGGSITVDGTVTANAGTGTFTVDGSGVTQPVSGTVTANAGTGTMTVDLGANNDVTIEGGAVLGTTGVAGPANAISIGGTESGGTFREVNVDANGNLQVDLVTANVTNAGTFAVQVDGDALTALQLIDNIVQTEDSIHSTGDSGVMALGVRQDTQSDFGADGDYVPVSIDANGAVRVNAINAGGTSNVDTASGSTDEGVVLLAVRDDSLTTLTPTDGDYTHLRVNSTGALHVTGGGGGTEYTEDDAAAANPVGNANILIRDDVPGAQVSADGDNVAQRGTNYGAAYCQIVDSSGNFVDSFGGSGGTAAADDADFTAGTTQGTPAMGVYESSPTSVTDGDLGTVGITSTRSLKVEETNSAAILADTANMDTNLGTVAGAVAGTEMQVDLVGITPDLALGTDISDVFGTSSLILATQADDVVNTSDGLQVSNFNYVFDGTTWDRLRGDSTDGMLVNLGSNNDVTVTGSVTADLGANNDVTVTGGNAHDGTTLGNPVLGGARATNSVEGITQVANADLTHIQADLNGVLLTRNATTLEEILTERVSNTNGTSTAFTTFAAGGAGIHNYITAISIHNAHASTNGYVDFRDGTAGSVIWTMPAPAGGGSVLNFDPPLKFAANTAVAYDVSAAITTIYISVAGFQAQG